MKQCIETTKDKDDTNICNESKDIQNSSQRIIMKLLFGQSTP